MSGKDFTETSISNLSYFSSILRTVTQTGRHS